MSEAGWSENVHVAMFEFMRRCLFSLHPSHLQLGRLEVGGVFSREVHLGLDAVQGRGLLKPEVRLQTETYRIKNNKKVKKGIFNQAITQRHYLYLYLVKSVLRFKPEVGMA